MQQENAIFTAIRASDAHEVWRMLRHNEAQIGTKSLDGISVYDMVMASGHEEMKSFVRTHMVSV